MDSSAKITRSVRKEDAEHEWWILDAEGQTVGRLCTRIASLLRGKHKPWFTPHVDCGDFVVVVNAEKIQLKGKRIEQKEYFRHTGYPGGGRVRTFKELLDRKPEFIIEHAVKGMIPKNRLGRQIIKKLKIYKGPGHPHEAQQPKKFEIDD